MPLLKIFNGKAMVVSESEDLPISYSFIHAFGRKAEDKVDSFYFHGTIVPIPLTAQKTNHHDKNNHDRLRCLRCPLFSGARHT